MKKIYCLAFLLLTAVVVNAQDEGIIVKKERFKLNQGIHIGGGPSLTLTKDIGDYSTGISFEVGYTNRLNRVLSIGPSISYLSFEYDKKVTNRDFNSLFIGGQYVDHFGYPFYMAAYYDLGGGDIKMYSLSCDIKLNLIPVTDASIVSIYAFAKPFVSAVSRSAITGTLYTYNNYGDPENVVAWEDALINNNNPPAVWEAGAPMVIDYTQDGVFDPSNDLFVDLDQDGTPDQVSDELGKKSSVTGGIFVGPGIEFMPTRKVSIYLQAAIGYTLPVSFINTEDYKNEDGNFDVFLQDGGEKYPTQKKGFSSLNMQAGLTFNF